MKKISVSLIILLLLICSIIIGCGIGFIIADATKTPEMEYKERLENLEILDEDYALLIKKNCELLLQESNNQIKELVIAKENSSDEIKVIMLTEKEVKEYRIKSPHLEVEPPYESNNPILLDSLKVADYSLVIDNDEHIIMVD